MSEIPDDIIQTACGIVMGLDRGVGAIASALQSERNNWKDAVDEAAVDGFDMGRDAERLRVIEIVNKWESRLNGSEYLSRQIDALRVEIAMASSAVSLAAYAGKTIVIHPDFPPHIWDGEKMTRIET